MDLEGLTDALSVPGATASYSFKADDRLEIVWHDSEDKQVGDAILEKRDEDDWEWVRLYIQPAHRNRGIFTSVIKWSVKQPETHYIAANANEADFYRSVGFKGDDLMVLDRKHAKRWLNGR